MKECPCRDCNERVLGCHSICLKYANWSRLNEEEREMIYNKKQMERIGHNSHWRKRK